MSVAIIDLQLDMHNAHRSELTETFAAEMASSVALTLILQKS